jgi:hypothetical protein
MSHARTWKDNAAEFAALDRGEGWQFAILVACSVEKGAATGRPQKTSAIAEVSGKVSAAEFARAASTSDTRVMRYLDAWQEAAAKGWVESAEKLVPDDSHNITVPDKPWRAKDGGVYDASRTGGQINNVEQIADKAARDADYAARLGAAVAPHIVREAIATSPEVARVAMDALDKRYEDAPKPVAPREQDNQSAGIDLVTEFRRLHRGVDQIVQLVNEGKAVVSDDTRDAILREVKWLRTALGYIEDGVSSNSLAEEIAAFLGADR